MPMNEDDWLDGLFPERLRTAIKYRDMTARQVADACGISEFSISRYLGGERMPNSRALRMMAGVLGVSADYLLGLTDDPSLHVGSRQTKLDLMEACSSVGPSLSLEDRRESVLILLSDVLYDRAGVA